MKSNTKLAELIQVSLFWVIVSLLAFTPMGYINIGILKVTIIHIPVIIASISFGPKIGGYVGFMFGLTSFINNTFISPSVLSFLFTPFFENAFGKGNLFSLIICFIPRILTGVIPYYFYIFLKKLNLKTDILAISLASMSGALTNTVLVMSMVYAFFGESYSAATNIIFDNVYQIILIVFFTNGIYELVVAGIICTIICNKLKSRFNKS